MTHVSALCREPQGRKVLRRMRWHEEAELFLLTRKYEPPLEFHARLYNGMQYPNGIAYQ
ncbi:hypothetical protein E2C01_037048 [Portunus trituberculatus]|uniref:Uncharacterized protein n=1 Tax=Portunus trituberculatus TaxID=210409 RepID=A0A5B7FAD3_PORTR|nr:hypothetical protein [Portunus trituberculatus]